MTLYTDDPMGGVVGVDRMARFLTCWTRCTKRMRLLVAIASKRQLGCSVKWIGARYYSIGVLLITKDKRLKAMHDLHLPWAHDLNCGDLQSLNGLLEFVLVVMCLRRNWMAGMYEAFQAGGPAKAGPKASPHVTKLLTQSMWRWITRLSV